LIVALEEQFDSFYKLHAIKILVTLERRGSVKKPYTSIG
jgi:hypothetical protein